MTQTQNAIVSPKNVPLVSPQSTLPENSGSTLKPPPGFTKPAEPMNYAAFMDDCLYGSRFSSTEVGNSTFSNLCNANSNNNPLAFPNTVYNPLISQPEALIQFWKQKLQMELTAAITQFLLVSNNASILNDTILNNSSTVSPATSTNPIIEQSHTNPFQTYQKANGQESSTVTNSLEELTNNLVNLNTNESNNSNLQSNETRPNLETLPSLSNRDSNHLGFDEQNLSTSKPTERFDKTFLNKTQSDISKESYGANCAKINDQEFTVEQLHDTNPFKQHLLRSFDDKIKFRKEQSVEPNFENACTIKPPIPPRNPNLINNTENISTKGMTDDTHHVSPVYNKQQTIPTTKIYYKAEPVMYNSRNKKTNETKSKLEKKITKLSDSVSLRGINHYDIANSSQDFTNHSLSKNTKSLQSGIDSQLEIAQTNNIFTSSTNFPTNHTQFMSPRILPNNYRPPPPPYNENNSAEYPYIKKSPISPRFTSPVMSESSKVAIEEVQLATESNYFEKLKSLVTETPGPIKRGKTLRNPETFEERIASSSSMKNNNTSSEETTSESTLNCQHAASPHTSYKINLILPKFLQEEQSTINLKQEQPDILYPTKVLNETSGVTLTFEKVAQNSVEQAQSSLMRKENNTELPWSVEHQEFDNLNGVSSSKNSERLQSYQNWSETETGNHTTAQACKGFDTKVKENAFNSMPTLHSPQTSVNQQNLFQKDYDNSNIASKGGTTVDNNCFQFCNTELRNASPKNISYSHQPQPLMTTQALPPSYPNNCYSEHGPNYPHHIPPLDVQYMQAGQRVPLFRPCIQGSYSPAPYWPRPQFFNPAFPHLPNNISPPLRQPYPGNPYNSHMFVHKQTGDRSRMAIPNSQTTFKTESSKESVTLKFNDAKILGQEKNRNMNTVESKETPTDGPESKNPTTNHITEDLTNSHSNNTSNSKYCTSPTQLDELNTRAASQKISKNESDNFIKEDTTSTQGLSDAQVLAVLLPKNKSEKSSNDSIPQRTLSRTITNVFKAVEVNDQTIYIFNIENEGWASTDEIALTFTQYENHDMILRLLELVHVQINFKEVSRAQSPLLFAELDRTTIRLPRMTNSKRIKGILHLIPLNSLVRMMYYLKVISVEEIVRFPTQTPLPPGSKVPELVHLITSYRSDDEYWTA